VYLAHEFVRSGKLGIAFEDLTPNPPGFLDAFLSFCVELLSPFQPVLNALEGAELVAQRSCLFAQRQVHL
jgi:hypothetical protein